MLKFPGDLSAERFLQDYWQKKPLFMPTALDRLHPSISRNELGWLATLDDVESRIVFVDRGGTQTRYRAESGPFDIEFLRNLPKRDWTLLVHDVEKHIPAMRRLIKNVPFIPDWRIDDVMVSFAVPGGGVGPHQDNYDVFLCQGIGERHWRYSTENVGADENASADIALLSEFSGREVHDTVAGDVLYLPPNVAHWGTATRACMTYSIGMRAPQLSDLIGTGAALPPQADVFYQDADLATDEAIPGLISKQALLRAESLVQPFSPDHRGAALGCAVTQTKAWLTPETVSNADSAEILAANRRLTLHGMTRIAFDEAHIYLNGRHRQMSAPLTPFAATLCAARSLSSVELTRLRKIENGTDWLKWLLTSGAFDLPDRI